MSCNPTNGRGDFEHRLTYKTQLHSLEWNENLSADSDDCQTKIITYKINKPITLSIWLKMSLGPKNYLELSNFSQKNYKFFFKIVFLNVSNASIFLSRRKFVATICVPDSWSTCWPACRTTRWTSSTRTKFSETRTERGPADTEISSPF